jgi:hypothetical protein
MRLGEVELKFVFIVFSSGVSSALASRADIESLKGVKQGAINAQFYLLFSVIRDFLLEA